MSTCGLLFFSLETWHEFHSMHTAASQKHVQALWDSIIHSDNDVRRLEDNMGKVHLGISVEMLRGYAPETAVAALLKDWLLVDAVSGAGKKNGEQAKV